MQMILPNSAQGIESSVVQPCRTSLARISVSTALLRFPRQYQVELPAEIHSILLAARAQSLTGERRLVWCAASPARKNLRRGGSGPSAPWRYRGHGVKAWRSPGVDVPGASSSQAVYSGVRPLPRSSPGSRMNSSQRSSRLCLAIARSWDAAGRRPARLWGVPVRCS